MMGLVILMVFLTVAQLMVQPSHALSCGQVDASLAPCVPYLTGGGTPTGECCKGVSTIRDIAVSITDKRDACNCVKNAANRYPNLRDDAALSLADKCHVQLDIPVSRTTNCDAVSQSLTCGQVDAALAQCVPYLIGSSGVPTAPCCEGVKNIRALATTTVDKRAACNCVKNAANRYSNLSDEAAKALPDKCGVQLDIPVSRTVNCEAIS